MSSDAMAIQTMHVSGRPWVETLHAGGRSLSITSDWASLYILYALVFLIIGGLEATIIRIQLMRPHNTTLFHRKFSTACLRCTAPP